MRDSELTVPTQAHSNRLRGENSNLFSWLANKIIQYKSTFQWDGSKKPYLLRGQVQTSDVTVCQLPKDELEHSFIGMVDYDAADTFIGLPPRSAVLNYSISLSNNGISFGNVEPMKVIDSKCISCQEFDCSRKVSNCLSVVFYTGCPSSSGSYSLLVPWSGGDFWALLNAQAYFRDLCCPTPGTRGRSSLRSMERGLLFVTFARTSTSQVCRPTFSVVGPTVWNGLPLAQRLHPRILSDTFYSSLTTFLAVQGRGHF